MHPALAISTQWFVVAAMLGLGLAVVIDDRVQLVAKRFSGVLDVGGRQHMGHLTRPRCIARRIVFGLCRQAVFILAEVHHGMRIRQLDAGGVEVFLEQPVVSRAGSAHCMPGVVLIRTRMVKRPSR
jgi:hypothetical protein